MGATRSNGRAAGQPGCWWLMPRSVLVGGVEHAERTKAEGVSESLERGSSAVASLTSGVIVAGLGFGALGSPGLLFVAGGVLAVVRVRGELSLGLAPS